MKVGGGFDVKVLCKVNRICLVSKLDTNQAVTAEDKSSEESCSSKRKRKKSRWGTAESIANNDTPTTLEISQTPSTFPHAVTAMTNSGLGPIAVVNPVLGGCATPLVTQQPPQSGKENHQFLFFNLKILLNF